MDKNSLLEELRVQVWKTCHTYGVNVQPDMDDLDRWTALVKKLDSPTKHLLKARLQEDVAAEKDELFSQMLHILNDYDQISSH